MMKMGKVFGTTVLVTATLFFLFTTWASGTVPDQFAKQLGLSILNPGGTNEIRSQYAGFFLAAALACVGSLAGFVPRTASFFLLAVVFGGLLAGRFVSLAINGGFAGFGPWIRLLCAVDLIGFALAIAAMATNEPKLKVL